MAKIEARTRQLLLDDEVEGKKGIIPYLLTGEEKHLNLRAFTDAQRLKMYGRTARRRFDNGRVLDV